ncbi:MAG TPA: S-methyl-5-thioribose-1-phosphate isomerase [Anaerolineales bacterium]|nr:S-methyl-5-thioribose-1-phosphate isomerase [Anaerolineales bacterium]
MRTVFWDYDLGLVKMIDQRLLPAEFIVNEYVDHHLLAEAIREMVVRGAPAIGAAAAFGLALAAFASEASSRKDLLEDLDAAARVLHASRPTAVNLAWALARIRNRAVAFEGGPNAMRDFILAEAQRIADEDVEINRRMAAHGAALIEDGDTVIHHCNTGALATVDYGTALGVIRMAHELGKRVHVLVDETRPRLQGARLTAWELENLGIPYEVISDNAAGFFLKTGRVAKCFVGSDRTASNGDVGNKIGTYMLALAANDSDVPFYAVVPTSTIDMDLASGDQIPIEERDPGEVLDLQQAGAWVAPEATRSGGRARNPAFDVTPARLVTGIVTENGIAYPPFTESLANLVGSAE